MSNKAAPGALPSDWEHMQRLGLTPDLLPVVSDATATLSPNSKLKELGKTPSMFNRDGNVVGIVEWTKKVTTPREVERWSHDPRLGILVKTGARCGWFVIDNDIADPVRSKEVVDYVTLITGELPMRYRSNSGKCLLAFRMRGEFPKRVIKTMTGAIEFLGTGQQFVAVGTHPTGVRYEWKGGLPAEPPELSPDVFFEMWAGMQQQFGVEPELVSRGGLARPAVPRSATSVNDDVVEFLLGKHWVKSWTHDGRLNITCPWESEHTTGTPGDADDSSTQYFPAGVGGFERGHFRCLHAHCTGRRDHDFTEAVGLMAGEFDDVSNTAIETMLDGTAFLPIVDLSNMPALAPMNAGAHVPALGDPVAFPEPFPGVMAAAVAAGLSSAPKPQPALTITAVLVGMAAACPGVYRLPSGMRLNLYGVGVAATGAGKDLPRQVGVAVARAAGAKTIGKPGSGQGLEDALESHIGMLCEVDEIAHMLAAANAPKTSPHLIELSGNLLKLFSASNGSYHTRVLARARGSLPSRTVMNPCLSLLGFATPHTLGTAVSSANVADGLLGRVLFAFGVEGVTPKRISRQFQLPEIVSQVAEQIRQATNALAFGEEGRCIDIVITPEAEQRLAELLVSLDKRAQSGCTAFEQALRARSFEKLERIAGVLAVWENPAAPMVRLDHVEWALKAIQASDAAAIRFTTVHMHDGEVQANAAKVTDTVRRVLDGNFSADRKNERAAVERGFAPRSLVLRRSRLDKEKFDKAVAHLQDTGDLLVAREKSDADKGGQRARDLYKLPGVM